MGFIMGEAKEVLSLQMLGDHDKDMTFFFFFCQMFPKLQGKKGRKRGEGQTQRILPKLPFWDIYIKDQHIHFLVHGHFSWSTFSLHLVKGPKALNAFFRNRTMKSVT